MHSLKKSVKPEIVNRYDLWVLRHKMGGAFKPSSSESADRGRSIIQVRMHSSKKSVKLEIVNRYDLWVLRHKIGGAIKCL